MGLSPIFLTTLSLERGLSLFDFFHKTIGKPLTTNLLTVRSVQSSQPQHEENLKRIFDERIINEKYWTNDILIDDPYLDFEIHYHYFIPTHVKISLPEVTKARNLKIFCGQYYDSMNEILQISNPDSEGTYEIDHNLYDNKQCKFFRYQMVGLNINDYRFFDMKDFDMFGDLYGMDGLYPCSFNSTLFNGKLILIILAVVE